METKKRTGPKTYHTNALPNLTDGNKERFPNNSPAYIISIRELQNMTKTTRKVRTASRVTGIVLAFLETRTLLCGTILKTAFTTLV